MRVYNEFCKTDKKYEQIIQNIPLKSSAATRSNFEKQFMLNFF